MMLMHVFMIYDIHSNMYLKCTILILLCVNHRYTLCSSRLFTHDSLDEHEVYM